MDFETKRSEKRSNRTLATRFVASARLHAAYARTSVRVRQLVTFNPCRMTLERETREAIYIPGFIGLAGAPMIMYVST